jgi:two-component system cell cycle response regulator
VTAPGGPADGDAVRLLLVEDSSTQARFIQHALRDLQGFSSFDVVWVETLEAALACLECGRVDLVLLDLMLPDSEGVATFARLYGSYSHVPIIVLSGVGDEAIAMRAVSEGAQDYLIKKTVSPELLGRSIRYGLERHRAMAELRRLALVDELTGVHNRRGFMLLGEQQLAVARRAGLPVTVLFVDVDGLKRINDTLGHEHGDRALVAAAELMRRTFRASDVVGRVGGDEFAALLVSETEPATSGERLRAAIDEYNRDAGPPELSCSVGAVRRDLADDSTLQDLLAEADRAMYRTRQGARAGRAAPDPPPPGVPPGGADSESEAS